MTFDELKEAWSKDSKFDQLAIEKEIVKIPEMHEKYLKELTTANSDLHKIEKALDKLTYIKYRYYTGKMDLEEIREYGWEGNQEIILRSDMPMVLAADKDVSALTEKKKEAENKVNYCQSVIKEINNRNWQIRALIDWKKFAAGN